MGRIAELLERKALGQLTEAEKTELNTLVKEAELAQADAPKPKEGEEEDLDEEVDKLAQGMANKMQVAAEKAFKPFEDRIGKLVEGFQPNGASVVGSDENRKSVVIVDAKLGQKTVGELGEMKVALPGRKTAGKVVTEVSMKTVLFCQALINKNVEKLQLLSEGTAADGGYLVPEEFANMIIEDVRDKNIMRQLAAPAMTISSDTLHMPSLQSRPKATFRGEKTVKNTSTAQFGENVLTPYSLAVIVGLSQELGMDASLGVSGSIVNYVAGLMSTSIAEREEQAFWTGSGSSQPTGIDGGAYTLRTIAVGAGGTDTQRADAIIQAFQRTPQGYRNKAVWIGNSASWEEVGRLKDSQNRYLLTDLANSPTQTLRGRPVYESNYLAGGTLLFADLSYYQIVDRQGIQVAVSNEATVAGSSAFERNLTFVRVEKRVDAELLLPAAVTKVTGMGVI